MTQPNDGSIAGHAKSKGGLVGLSGAPLPTTAPEPTLTDKPLGSIEWQPMPGKVVVKVLGERETYGKAGLIIRPQTVLQPRTTGKVIAVYEPFIDYGDKEETSSYLTAGDIVVFGRHSGVEVEFGGDKVVILREQEILTRVKIESPEDVQHLGVAARDLDDVEA